MKDYAIKGSSIQAKLDWVREKYGVEAEAEMRKELRQRGVVLLLESSWYPAETYEFVNRTLAERFLGGQLERLEEVGAFSAERALATVYRAYLERGDFPRFLERISSLHQRFFNLGEMKVVAEASSCQIVLSGAPSYPEGDMHVARGFYQGAARHFGLQGVSCSLERSSAEARFLLSWSAAGSGASAP